jgi:hypothetical protein
MADSQLPGPTKSMESIGTHRVSQCGFRRTILEPRTSTVKGYFYLFPGQVGLGHTGPKPRLRLGYRKYMLKPDAPILLLRSND